MLYVEMERVRRILTLALPIIGGMVSQNLFNLVDTAMVGVLGDVALAAVGIGGFTSFMFQAIVIGVASGVQAMSSRLKGAGDEKEMAYPLNAALFIVVIVGPLLSLLLCLLTPLFFPLLNNSASVIAEGVPYVQARVAAMTFVGINLAFRGYWSAVNLPGLFMKTLLISHIANIFLNYLLIFGNFGFPALGVTGAGIASLLATALGSMLYLYLGWKHACGNGFLKSRPTLGQMKTLFRLSLPSSVEQLFFAGGFTMLFGIIGIIGTSELAAANVLIQLMLIVIYPAIGLGIAAGSLAGQSLGKNDYKAAKDWGWNVLKVGIVFLGFLGIPMWLAPEIILAPFIHDQSTLKIATGPLCLIGITIAFIESFGMIFMYALLGAGDSKRVMIVSISCLWGIYLPLAYLLGPIWGYGLLEIWFLHTLGYRGLLAICFTFLWIRGKWQNVKV